MTDHDPSLEDLVILYDLSVRGYNVCEKAGLNRLSLIRAYAVRHGGFHALKNCGHKTQLELESILRRSGSATSIEPMADAQELELPTVDREQLSHVCVSLFMGLGTRARNILLSHAGGTTPDELIRFFMQQGRKMPKLPGAGSLVMRELREMRAGLFSAMEACTVADPSIADTRTSLEQWADRHQVPRTSLTELSPRPGEFYPLRFLQWYMTTGLTDRRGRIAQEFLCLTEASNSLGLIAQRHGLSRERVRQLRVQMDKEMPKFLQPFADLPGVHEHFPDLVTPGDHLVILEKNIVRANEREGTTWSPLLFQYLAHVLNRKRLVVLPWRWMAGAGQDRETAGDRPVVLVAEELMESLEAAFALARFHHERPRVTPMALAIDVLVKDLPTERIDRVRAMLI